MSKWLSNQQQMALILQNLIYGEGMKFYVFVFFCRKMDSENPENEGKQDYKPTESRPPYAQR